MIAAIIPLLFSSAVEVRLPEPPLGLDLFMPVPEDNPLTPEKVALGRRLFFDRRLSRDGSVACATSHDPARAFSDGRPVASGIGGALGTRNSPAIINRGYGSSFFWDGRAPTLERQVLEPILNPKELGLADLKEVEVRAGIPANAVAAALGGYVRTIRAGGSRFDRYMAGEVEALSPQERAGVDLFRGKANCVACHVGPNFTDEKPHNTGIAWRDGNFADMGAGQGDFKTPTLREVARTAPYMHDGSLATLDDVVEYYSGGGRPSPELDTQIRRLDLTAEEKRALVSFLRALSGEVREGWR